jgi:predicted GNAT family acetyltransferase
LTPRNQRERKTHTQEKSEKRREKIDHTRVPEEIRKLNNAQGLGSNIC